VETLGGELPEEICKMRDYLKFIREQNHVYREKMYLLSMGHLEQVKPKLLKLLLLNQE